ncbi:MAG TPA: TauD/TfdA family dioxygenase [Candidatus Angelobacter sp.]|nr:TauD/TfdA family dioxygenase [Candidatus Angelobacter sp.]
MNSDASSLMNPATARRAKVIRPANLISTEPLAPGSKLPLVIRPCIADLELVPWAASQRKFLQSLLLQHGGLLFRNFCISGVEEFQKLITAVSGEPLEYREQTSPRHKVQGNIYTSTEYPPQYRIFMHNENSYSLTWPLKIMFFCVTAPTEGGETPIADVRRVLTKIPEEIRARFAQDGWMLVRNFGTGYGLSWQTAFQTEDRSQVNRYCEANGIEFEWLSEERLRVRQRRPAIARHPVTGEAVWFNHAAFYHTSTLNPEVLSEMRSELAEEDLPFNTYYGDGTAIEPEALDIIRRAYESETILFTWRENDLLLLDNMLAAHGRSPFRGPRRIVVGMAEPFSSGNLK